MMSGIRVLGIEDNDIKWQRVSAVLAAVLPADTTIVRAIDLYEGQRFIEAEVWDLLLLDMSLNIRSSSQGQKGGHDYTGGLKIAGRMYYLNREAPTIIITGFDAFPSGQTAPGQDVILGLDDVARQAAKYLGDNLIGTVRYGPEGWDHELRRVLLEFLVK